MLRRRLGEHAVDATPTWKLFAHPLELVPIDGKIKQWAQEVVDAAGAKTDLEKARAIYNHIVSTVKYDKSARVGDVVTSTTPVMLDAATARTFTPSSSAMPGR